MQKTNQIKTSLNTTALLEATGGNKVFFNQMMDTFIENAETTYKGLEDGLREKKWSQIGEHAHKAIPSFKYFDLDGFVQKFKTLEDFTIREPEYDRVPEMVENVLIDLDNVISDARNAKFPVG